MKLALSGWKINLAILGIYALIAVITTYPMITGIIWSDLIPGAGHDEFYFLWHLWWIKHAILNLGTSPLYTTSIFHPQGGPLLLASPFNEIIVTTLQPLLSLTRAYTFVIWFSFPMAAFTTYLLGLYLTHQRWAAFIGGLIYSFSAYHYIRAVGYLGLVTIQWLPLYVLGLFFVLKRPTFRSAVFLLVSFMLAVMSEHVYYVFYFVLPVTIIFIVYQGLAQRIIFKHWQFWLVFGGALALGSLLVLPIYLPFLNYETDTPLKHGGVTLYVADIVSYLLPYPSNPIFNLPSTLYEPIKVGEGPIFIGYMALLLMLLGLITAWTRNTKFWLWVGGIAFIFSLGPILNILGRVTFVVEGITLYVPLPYVFLVDLPFISLLRAPTRLAVTVQLAVAILATYGVSTLSRRWSSRWMSLVYVLVGTVILVETLIIFPYPMTDASVPSIYSQIAQEPNRLAVLEIPSKKDYFLTSPKISRMQPHIYQTMYYASVHQHPLVGGDTARTPFDPWDFLEETAFVRELIEPDKLHDTPYQFSTAHQELGLAQLAGHDIGYVILHRELVNFLFHEDRQAVPEKVLRMALGQPFYDDGQIVGFRVPSEPKPKLEPQPFELETAAWGEGWFPQGMVNYRPLHWMGQTGLISMTVSQPTRTRLSIQAFAPMANNVDVSLWVNETLVDTFPFAPTRDHPGQHMTPPFLFEAGLNQVKFEAVPQGGLVVEQVDPRLYLGVYNLKLYTLLNSTQVTPSHARTIQLNNTISLLGYDHRLETSPMGQSFYLTLYWETLAKIDKSYKIFIHIINQQHQLIVQQDSMPVNWLLPTTVWEPTEVVIDQHILALPPDTLPGLYQVWVGMYDPETGQRLTITDEGGVALPNHAILLFEMKLP